jgi:broad specificity phosphatase PhoE
MRLIIIRHGETIENSKGICQGQTNGQLSEKGIEQAKKLSLRFKRRKIDAIYSSDLARAKDTAQEIIKYHPKLQLQLDKRLRERFLGPAQGKAFPENFSFQKLPKEAESDQTMYERVKAFYDHIMTQDKNKTVIIVTHGGPKRALLCIIHKQTSSEMKNWNNIQNTSVSEYTSTKEGNYLTKHFNCITHLSKKERANTSSVATHYK